MYTKEFERLFNMMGKAQKMALATSMDNRVTARTMSFVIENERLYFQTDTSFTKFHQIKSNPLVAVCWNNIQLEGSCKILGHPFESQNLFFKKSFEENYRGSYEKYSHLSNEILVEIEPILVTVWGYDDAQPYREFFDFKNRHYLKEYYNLCN